MLYITSVLSLLALAGSSMAQTAQPARFALQLSSSNTTYNGSFLFGCHVGGGINALCLGDRGDVFQLDSGAGAINTTADGGIPGVLRYTPAGFPANETQGMAFYVAPTTNVALPLFGLSTFYQPVAFNTDREMNVQSDLDDTVTPPTGAVERVFRRWYACQTNFESNVRVTLNWLQGAGPASNPSCEAVTVVRSFVP